MSSAANSAQLSAPPNTEAFNPHKLGTRGLDRTVLRMSLFSNTVMITIHPMRKCSSFSGCETISFSLFTREPCPDLRDILWTEELETAYIKIKKGQIFSHSKNCFMCIKSCMRHLLIKPLSTIRPLQDGAVLYE